MTSKEEEFINVRNFADLKRVLKKDAIFKVIDHKFKHLVGKIRVVTIVQTNGLYTQIYQNPNDEYSTVNGGKGSRMEFNKASHYSFGDTVKWFNKPIGSVDIVLIMEFSVIKSE